LLSRSAALALARVQTTLRGLGLTLKVYDCYRPQRAVDHFVRWAEELDDQRMKPEFYPSVDKRFLFRDGYIAARSGHSRASTVDLTIAPRDTGAATVFDPSAPLRSCESPAEDRSPDDGLDMGTGYDCFSPLSHTASRDIGPQQRANRLLLETLMETNGFASLDEEWWHYTLVDEPYPDRYFDFPIE
jgi:D-alanyl-D-alanine dipeptidase